MIDLKDTGISKSNATYFDYDYYRFTALHNRLNSLRKQLFLHKDDQIVHEQFVISEFSSQLNCPINTYLIFNTLFTSLISPFSTVRSHWESFSNLPWICTPSSYSLITKKYLENLKVSLSFSRRHELIWRLKTELIVKNKQGWFIIFNTLTVRPEDYSSVFSRGSNCFSNYIKRFDSAVGGKPNHTYFAVTEEGATHGRLHIHVVHIINNLPLTWSDPNRYVVKHPVNRIINCVRGLWSFGYSSPIAVRFGPSDPYSRLRWLWPVLFKDGVVTPIDSGSPVKLAGYIGKYLNKTYIKEGKSLWRTKMRKSFGSSLIDEVCNQLSLPQLIVLLRVKDTRQLMVTDVKFPLVLLKKRVSKAILSLYKDPIYRSKQLMALESLPSIIEQLKLKTTSPLNRSSLSTTSTLTTSTDYTDISKVFISVFSPFFNVQRPDLIVSGSFFDRK